MEPAPRRVPVADEPAPPELARRVAAVLDGGGVVALPTETVYGLAAWADDERALAALAERKGGGRDAGFTWHVGAHEALERFPRPSPMARRLARRYWPGPLTLVLPGVPPGLEPASRDGWTGLRLPAHAATAGILAALERPIALTSANTRGESPACTADEVEALFGERVELLLDGGRTRLGESSAVLRVGPGAFELLRPGLLRESDLARTAGLRIAFVCTGNTCRSPMAEALARHLLAARLQVPPSGLPRFGFELRSMGVFAGAGSPAAPHAVDTLAALGIDLSDHRSSPALSEVVAAQDRVYCLTASHLEALTLSLPPGRADHLELLDPEGRDVPDPIGGSREDYERCAATLRTSIERRLDEWA